MGVSASGASRTGGWDRLPSQPAPVVRGLAVDSALSGLPGVQFGVHWSWFLKKKTNSVGGPEGLAVRDNRLQMPVVEGMAGFCLGPGRLPLSLEPFTLPPWASL